MLFLNDHFNASQKYIYVQAPFSLGRGRLICPGSGNKGDAIECVHVTSKEPLKVLSSPGIRGNKFISVYSFPAQ